MECEKRRSVFTDQSSTYTPRQLQHLLTMPRTIMRNEAVFEWMSKDKFVAFIMNSGRTKEECHTGALLGAFGWKQAILKPIGAIMS